MTAELLSANSLLIQRNRAARVALASAYNLQEPNMGQHEVTYTIVPFGTRYRVTILVDNYPIEKNHFYHLRDAEVWAILEKDRQLQRVEDDETPKGTTAEQIRAQLAKAETLERKIGWTQLNKWSSWAKGSTP